MKKQFRMKTLVISLTITGMLLSPLFMSAQTGRQGLFDMNNNKTLGNRGAGTGISNQTFGSSESGTQTQTQVPLGSGILILMAAGAGYVALKKKDLNTDLFRLFGRAVTSLWRLYFFEDGLIICLLDPKSIPFDQFVNDCCTENAIMSYQRYSGDASERL